MKTKNIFKTLVLAAVLVSACSKNEIDNDFKGYTLPVTINVTRQGDDATTRATYDGESKKLSFSTGDKLFVAGSDSKAGDFAGLLAWQSEGTFSGTIMTENEYDGTAEELLSSAADDAEALLIPAGYKGYEYLELDDEITPYAGYYQDKTNAFALTKAAAVEQFSFELAETYSSGFKLSPQNAIVSFTISGLTASKEVAVSFDTYSCGVISKSVTTSAEGVATFAIGLDADIPLENCTLTVDGNNISMPTKTTAAGKIYNISRNAIPGALIGKFSVSSTKKVYFSKGNLQATTTNNGTNWTWSFAAHQWDYVGNAAANTAINGNKTVSTNGTVDLFGWSTSNTYNGIHNSTSDIYSGAFVDWGSHSDVIAGIDSGWHTLSMAEWTYLLATRTVNGGKGADKSYTLNQSVNGKRGMVIYPDNYTGAVYSGDNWASFEAAGCVFLPAAGWRDGTTIKNSINDRGYYWSTTPSNATAAKRMFFAGGLELTGDNSRAFGFSVRLVREVK